MKGNSIENMVMVNKLSAIINEQFKLLGDMNKSLNYIKELAADKLEYIELYQDKSKSTTNKSSFNIDDYEQNFIQKINDIEKIDIQKKVIEDIKQKLNMNEEMNSVNKEYDKKLEEEQERFLSQSRYKRYAANKEFQEFRETLWDVKNEGRTMPSLVAYTRQKYGYDDEMDIDNLEEEDDDNIIITNRQESFICPITKRIMNDPLISKTCKHSYSSVIKEIIKENNERRIECPVAGCIHYVSLNDLRPNKLLARKIRRKRFLEMEEEMEEREKYE
ncbi:hypothetical protein BCR32DRAFT_247432 [Anaeromyces robustus]|uniref:SP-RING-type domain-containing protein n=1 Tax=Anaeromyces robustus TaxID=1754192 RepID=A0A1Y1WXD3_9FUNG|nr:hypothetical protein BCR32DRAFT_247432 [Anaeromyces robustus]|eukprot:ORX78102.1 hypothetical protein BCR32DRAFT_247432 [Anaeromyces robustus]